MPRLILLLLAMLGIDAAIAQETLRCGSKIVTTGMSMDEVRKYCGAPTSSEIEEHDVRAGPRVIGKTELHIWRYRRASGQRTAVLEFDQDKLLTIKYEKK